MSLRAAHVYYGRHTYQNSGLPGSICMCYNKLYIISYRYIVIYVVQNSNTQRVKKSNSKKAGITNL